MAAAMACVARSVLTGRWRRYVMLASMGDCCSKANRSSELLESWWGSQGWKEVARKVTLGPQNWLNDRRAIMEGVEIACKPGWLILDAQKESLVIALSLGTYSKYLLWWQTEVQIMSTLNSQTG